MRLVFWGVVAVVALPNPTFMLVPMVIEVYFQKRWQVTERMMIITAVVSGHITKGLLVCIRRILLNCILLMKCFRDTSGFSLFQVVLPMWESEC